jgi:hypothetical protein
MAEMIHVKYDREHWRLLSSLRGESLEMLEPLESFHIQAIAYGSIARGDVSPTSDIDIFVPNPPSPTLIEAALLRGGLNPGRREIIQATPSYAAKGYIYLNDLRGYSFPLVKLNQREREFYTFAGSVDHRQVEEGERVPGVDKRLMLIEPTGMGHVESRIQGREGVVARKLGVDIRIIRERIRTLERRDEVGRTGVFIKRPLSPGEGFGEVFHQLVREKPALRRRLRK